MLRTQARFPDVGPKEGHYESFYIKAVRPGGGEAIWIRHTIHKRPDRPPSCAVWFTHFDAQAKGPRATKVQYGADQMAVPRGGYIQVHSSELLDGRAHGSVHTDALQATWDLNFSDDHEPFFHLPRPFLYDAKLPKTKFLSPYPNALFNGRVTVDGELIPIERWRGMIGHNWGREHAERWVWVQGADFEGGSQNDYFDMAVGRIKVGGMTTPWVGNAMLMLNGEGHRLGGFEHVPSTKVDEQPTSCGFGLKGKGIKVTGRVGSDAKNFVAWVYADPVGPEHNTLNCSISDLELQVERKDAEPLRLTARASAAYEFGTRDRDHGIPLQPYPDG